MPCPHHRCTQEHVSETEQTILIKKETNKNKTKYQTVSTTNKTKQNKKTKTQSLPQNATSNSQALLTEMPQCPVKSSHKDAHQLWVTYLFTLDELKAPC